QKQKNYELEHFPTQKQNKSQVTSLLSCCWERWLVNILRWRLRSQLSRFDVQNTCWKRVHDKSRCDLAVLLLSDTFALKVHDLWVIGLFVTFPFLLKCISYHQANF
ncbi:unnamed protein product, partial [Candidula unifasciata]